MFIASAPDSFFEMEIFEIFNHIQPNSVKTNTIIANSCLKQLNKNLFDYLAPNDYLST